MTKSADPTPPRRLTETGTAWLILLGLSCLALMLFYLPRQVAPHETPGLHLDRAAVEAQLEADAQTAANAPEGALVERLDALYGDHGAAEGSPEPRGERQRRATALAAAVIELQAEEGEGALDALRARAAEQMRAQLDAPTGDARRRFLGDFEAMLERYGLTRDGAQLAPEIVVRALFKARWNAVHGRTLTEGLSATERAGYWGWLALESPAAPTLRLDALSHYEEASGEEQPEARAVLHFLSGQPLAAAEWFEQAAEEGPSLRLRNHALAAVEAAL